MRPLLELCLLRRAPQDLPYSPAAVVLVVVALLAVQLGFAHHVGESQAALSARLMVTLVILLGITPALLEWRGLGNRIAQALLALAGSSLVFSLVNLPLVLKLQPHLGDKDPPASLAGYVLVGVFLFVWKLRVDAMVWRHSLDIPRVPAYALTVVLVILEPVLLFLIGPVPVPAAP
ncbi:hypothetical protein [Arenimonas sp. MALMAid1274]|uniref:hypothetical protein n=1 Tax=Arenimonas sp. MALMAid1274 TaxID=3411630 RepID=UPI003BA0DFC8